MSIPILLRKLLLIVVAAPILLCLLLRWLPPPTTVFMVYRHVEDFFAGRSFQPIDYRWVNQEAIAEHAFKAVVAAEDQLFFQHHGFDFHAIKASIDDYAENGHHLRGASTITQQVAKNLFLTPSKNFLRKALEAFFTVQVELLWDKPRILEIYLNIAEFGDHLFGIEAASQFYFGVPAREISRSQAALLAATLPNPIKFKANRPSGYIIRRQRWILRQMQNLGG